MVLGAHNETGAPIQESRHGSESHMSSGQNVPRVTIGLPVFNGESYLRESIESLLNQSFRDFELLISDNASTDGTQEIIERFQQQDSRVRCVRQSINIGHGANCLFVLQQARTELFMWASDDDVWAQNWLEILTKSLTTEDIGVRGKVVLIRNGTVLYEITPPNFKKGDFVRYFMGNENNYRSHYAFSLFNREKLLATEIDSINLDYYPDAIFVYCLLEEGALRTIPETHLLYRLHGQNLGSEYSRRWKGWKKISYRIHPLRYYIYFIRYSRKRLTKFIILVLIPVKHLYAQSSFWVRGVRELITGKSFS